ncbi:hypothetical protein KBC31_03995 [Candidatus Saccharibacteria bacterium]|nr:hypothetical protein [Candidatus Saccharibacteria bacterium]
MKKGKLNNIFLIITAIIAIIVAFVGGFFIAAESSKDKTKTGEITEQQR